MRVRIAGMLLGLVAAITTSSASAVAANEAPTTGELRIAGFNDSEQVAVCPLEHTDVQCDIAGFLARTTVRQTFKNPLDRKIEAIYTFPLPQDAAVDEMVMIVGDRRIVGEVHERSKAREIYQAAKEKGHVASLLDQERPNIFTQSVANIEPGATVRIEISFVETLQYEDGEFQWTFPMVVGPRYIPGGGSAPQPMTTGTDTAQVPDASRITPPVTPDGTRAGHDISLTVSLDAGMKIHDLVSELHDVKIDSPQPSRATISLIDQQTIPNRDFVLKYRLATDQIGDAFLVHEDERGRYFTLILQPPRRVEPSETVPRELVFVLDSSGSMRGFPMDKSKALMQRMVDGLRPDDTFNVVTFAGHTQVLWEQPQPATRSNLDEAAKFVDSLQGRGGTEMMKAINVALDPDTTPFERIWDEAVSPPDRSEDMLRRGQRGTVEDDGIRKEPRTGSLQNVTVDGYLYRTPPADCRVSAAAAYAAAYLVNTDRTRALAIANDGAQVLPGADGAAVRLSGNVTATEAGSLLHVSAARSLPMRIVVFLTDGYVGNDYAIVDAIRSNADTTRVFSFGIGNSVNRFLLENMARAGRGEAEIVTLAGQADAVVDRLYERLRAPVLMNIEIAWGDLDVFDVYPRRVPDLFASKPILVHGRLSGRAQGIVTLMGATANGAYAAEIDVAPTGATRDNPAIPSLWARAKVDALMSKDMAALQRGSFPDDLKQQIIELGVNYRLLTQFTSFVAVEEMRITEGGEARTIRVPVEMPEGVSYEGVFGANARPVALKSAFGARRGRRMSRAAGAPPQRPVASEAAPAESAQRVIEDAESERAQPDPINKLDEKLRSMLESLDDDGTPGEVPDGVLVENGNVTVIVVLSEITDDTRAALEKTGFVISSEASTAPIVVGKIPVDQLEALAKLDAVRRIRAARPSKTASEGADAGNSNEESSPAGDANAG